VKSAGLLLLGGLVGASAPEPATLKLELRGLKPQGQVLVALYGSEGAWNAKKGAVRELRQPVKAMQARIELAGLAPGRYGAMIFQDLNMNGRMDFNLVGMPTEPYGFSNNSRGLFGPPAWNTAAFRLGGDAVHSVKLR
jgi:uncharacterized protein (DUF2141 family)